MMKFFRKHEEIIKYLIIGILTTVVSLFSYYVLTISLLDPDIPLELQIANIISWTLAVTFAYFTNRILVFKSSNKKKFKEAIKFYTSRIITLLLDMLIMYIMVSSLGINDRISKLVVQVIVTVINYILSKFIVFKK